MRWASTWILLCAAAHAAPMDWCEGEAYPLTRDERAWCDDPPPAESIGSPCLLEICEAAPRARLSYNRAGYPQRYVEQRREARVHRGGGVNVLFWAILGVGLAVILALLWRHRGELRVSHAPVGLGGPSLRRARPDAITLERPDALREAAFEAAARGDHPAAFALLHRALLWGLHDARRVRLHQAHTHGDYLDQLRAAPHLRRPIRPIFALADAVEFGGVAVGLAEWTELSDRVEALPPLEEAP